MKKRMLILIALLTGVAALSFGQFLPGQYWQQYQFQGRWMSERGQTIREFTGRVSYDYYGRQVREVRETVWRSTRQERCGYIWTQTAYSWNYERQCQFGVWWQYHWRYYWVPA